MARTYWPGENPIGKQIGLGSPKFPPTTVVGIVADIKHLSLREQTGPEMYVPYMQNPRPSMLIMQVALRTKAEPRSIFPRIERDVHSLYPDLPLAKVSRHSRVDSSIRLRMRTLRPSCVRALTKSQLHMSPAYVGLSRTHDPSLSHNRPLGFCLFGTFSPSRRQMRSTRSLPTFQRARTSNAVIRRYP